MIDLSPITNQIRNIIVAVAQLKDKVSHVENSIDNVLQRLDQLEAAKATVNITDIPCVPTVTAKTVDEIDVALSEIDPSNDISIVKKKGKK